MGFVADILFVLKDVGAAHETRGTATHFIMSKCPITVQSLGTAVFTLRKRDTMHEFDQVDFPLPICSIRCYRVDSVRRKAHPTIISFCDHFSSIVPKILHCSKLSCGSTSGDIET